VPALEPSGGEYSAPAWCCHAVHKSVPALPTALLGLPRSFGHWTLPLIWAVAQARIILMLRVGCQTSAPEVQAEPGLSAQESILCIFTSRRGLLSPTSNKPKRLRADQLMLDQGSATSLEQARVLILAGEVSSSSRRIDSAGQLLPRETVLSVRKRQRFVGRGGEKLAGALEAFGLDVREMVAVDVGASTGGFTDCLLQSGAARTYAVDVGRGQLAERLRNDPRVTSFERTNARNPYSLPELVDIAVMDVSFISLALVLPETIAHLKDGGVVVALVKPQFEAKKNQVGNKGVVSDPAVHAEVVGKVCLWVAERAGVRLVGVRRSVLQGDEGNREFFVALRVTGE
jgi:23S rRNA (cytidine1920-2'-O)/16S rRNA (cytidine1409-2'-O)-methyltransferase